MADDRTPSVSPTHAVPAGASQMRTLARNAVTIPDLGPVTAIFLLLIVICVGVAVRLQYLGTFDARYFEMMGDNAHHYNIAHNIAAGNGPVTNFVFGYWFRHPRIPAMSDFYSPGYHYSVGAAFLLFGESIHTARMTSLAWSALSFVALYLLASELFGCGVGVLSTAIWAFNRVEVTHSIAVMTESQFITFFLAGAWAALVAYRLDRAWFWAATGLLAGAAASTKGVAQPLLLGAAVFLVLGYRRGRWPAWRVPAMLAVTAVMYLAPQAPWAIQTHRYFGKPLFSHAYSVVISNDWSKSTYRTNPPTLAEYLRDNPPGYPILTRVRHVWRTMRNLPSSVSLGPLGVALILTGTWLARGPKSLTLVGLGVVYYAFILGVAGGDNAWRERYLLPLIALMSILAAVTVSSAARFLPWRRHGVSWLALLAATALAGWLTLSVPPPPQDLRRQHAYERMGQWVQKNTPADAPIMATFVQDVHFFTQRPTVMDPTLQAISLARGGLEHGDPSTYLNRSTEEVAYYHVAYVVVDPITSNGESEEQILGCYPGLILEAVYSDAEFPIRLFAVFGSRDIAPATQP